MHSPIKLTELLSASNNNIDPRKLNRLCESISEAIGRPYDEIEITDPMLLRRCLISHWKARGVSPGNIQAMEQFYMGIVRRAAIKGIVLAPPEGPWTHRWQMVINSAGQNNSAKLLARRLAAWFTEREIQPEDATDELLMEWVKFSRQHESDRKSAFQILLTWRESSSSEDATVLLELKKRLNSKASQGSVFAE